MITDLSKSTGYSSYGENARFPDSLAWQHIGKICIEGENKPPPPPPSPRPDAGNITERGMPQHSPRPDAGNIVEKGWGGRLPPSGRSEKNS